jgi:hypothetical protein
VPERKKGSATAHGSLVGTNQAKWLVRQLPTAAQWQTGPAKNHRKLICPQPELKEKFMTKKEKSLFDKAIDALTDRDEKAAAKAAEEKAAAEKAAAEKAAAVRAATQKATAERQAALRATVQKAAAEQAAAAPKKGVVTVRSLRIRADHNTTSEVVAGLVDGDEVTILSTWTDGKDTWAKLDKGWAAMVYDGETYIRIV